MKYFLFYNTRPLYLSGRELWTSNIPNICRIDDYDGNGTEKIIFNRDIGLYDILWEQISDPSTKRVTHEVLNPNEGYRPIALRIIAENFLGDNEPSRWIALKYMYFDNMNTTETGTQPFIQNAESGSLSNVGMTWNETSTYTPKTSTYTQEQLNTSRYKQDWTNINYTWPDLSFSDGTYRDDNFTNTTRVSSTYDWGYLASDAFANKYTGSNYSPNPSALFYPDTLRGWHNDAVSNNRFLPQLYAEDNGWVVSENPSEFGVSRALTYIHGKRATQQIVSKYANAAPLSGNTQYLGKCNYTTRLQELKPFYCCSHYHTPGTSAGDWYLPAIGELVFIMPDLAKIRTRLSEIHALYPNDCISSLASTYYWSASEYYWNYAWSLPTGNGYVSCYPKSNRFSCLAFLEYSHS